MQKKVEQYTRRSRRHRGWQRVVSVLAGIVVFVTTYALILPAITLEDETFCGIEEHTHDENCYTLVNATQLGDLICTYETLGVHVHSETCYDAEGNLTCGQADYVVHSHGDSCYDAEGNLVCQLPEIAPHVHDDSCYTEVETEVEVQLHAHGDECYTVEEQLTCTQEESEGHSHSAECYSDEETVLCCGQAESEGHSHSAECYSDEETVLCCTRAESQGHAHSDACYTEELICDQEESEDHTHGDGCYQTSLSCGLEESEGHTHTEDCYEPALICGCAESEGHTHTEDCYESALICDQAESQGHTHGEECWGEVRTLICELEEETEIQVVTERVLSCQESKLDIQTHVHSESCFEVIQQELELNCQEDHIHGVLCYGTWELTCGLEEHTHELICFSDPTADVETAEDWKKTFANVELTGVWADDVLAIAKTQLGYTESTKNYIVQSDGETIKGYTRYGAWYGIPYGDWCAMFASFCIHYAQVEDMPLGSACRLWIEDLEEVGLYEAAAEHTPQPGDLIFFAFDEEGVSDHVGIVSEVTEEKVTVIEGNSSNRVQYVTYDLDDEDILGYGLLPGQLTAEEQAEVDRVIEMIDAIPSADEIDAKMAEYEEAEDYEGMEAWYTEVVAQIAEAYKYYSYLTEDQKAAVTNADKLLELEYIWSAVTLYDEINSAAPTTTWYTSTKEFVELNLYDYNGNVNSSYWSTSTKYPGFQWNGGAYSKSSHQYSYSYTGLGIPYVITDRNYIDSIDFGNSLITNYTYGYGSSGDYSKSINATDVGKTTSYFSNTSPINWLYGNSSEGWTNKPIGTSTTDQTQSSSVMNKLLVDGYPALANGISLKYLFTAGTAVTKMNTKSIDGLFQQDSVTGEYSYNSRTNHAQYTNNFFQLYDQIITPNFITYPFGNFLPLNTISDSTKATQVGAFNYSGGMADYVERIIEDLRNDKEGLGSYWADTQEQLAIMLEEYKENWSLYPRTINGTSNGWSDLSAANAIRDYFWGDSDGNGDNPSDTTSFITQSFLDNMYNIDWDVQTNFFFGMEMKMNFMQPKGGMTGNDTNGDGESDYPMVFYFTGDDDVWVYIDGVLFLDLSGIHRHVGGKIDFVNGMVYYYALDTAGTGDVSDTPYQTYTFADILEAAGQSTDGLNSKGTFEDYSTHSFNFYYMERGSGSSVCRLNFNFPLLKKNSISVTKENVYVDEDGKEVSSSVLGDPDYYFNIVNSNNELFVGPNSVTGVTKYTILDSAGNTIGTGETDQYGIFTLKAGQTAVFEGIEENQGKYFIQELIKEEDNDQYPTVEVNEQVTRYNKLVDWSYRKYFYPGERTEAVYVGPYGYRWIGRSGYDADSSTQSSFYFEQQNHVDTSQLGSLSITKNLQTYLMTLADTYYTMYVTLDGTPLPVGTTYKVGSETKTVTQAGYIEIAAGETATISNIISGTKFVVQETEASAKGYTVTYSQTGADEVVYGSDYISGVVRVNTDVSVTVTNAEKGASVTIPGTKTIANPDGVERTYTFTLTEVTDSTGATVKDGGLANYEATATVTENGTFSFSINYIQVAQTTLPATYYYRIEEAAAPDSLANTTVYVVEVTVSETSDGIAAAVTGMWKDGTKIETLSADFVNTLVSSLTLEKTVDGGTQAQSQGFTFTIHLTAPDGMTLPATYPAVFYQQDGSTVETTVHFNEAGDIVLTGFKHGETAVISGIPYGTAWTITESGNDGYNVTTSVTTGEKTATGEGSVTSGTLTMEGTTVSYTNAVGYELPETGGAGTSSYTLAGLAMMLGAACLMYIPSKRRKGGKFS